MEKRKAAEERKEQGEENDDADEEERILMNGGIRRKRTKNEDLVKKVPLVSICPECDEKFQSFIEMDTHFRKSHDRK